MFFKKWLIRFRKWLQEKQAMDVCGVWPFTLSPDSRFTPLCKYHDDDYEHIRALYLAYEITLKQAKYLIKEADRRFIAMLYKEAIDLPWYFDLAIISMSKLVNWFGFSIWVAITKTQTREDKWRPAAKPPRTFH